jgi:beta-lactamase regulating signal transducer with metallopeptidase domain
LLLATRRLIRRSRELASGTSRTEFDRLLAGCQKRLNIALVESDQTAMPAAGGLFRLVILLPANVEQRLSRVELRALLAHELGHHARGDVRWLWFGRALCHVLPVQPLLFLAVRQWHQAAEPLCDDWALSRNISPITLARSLTNVAEWCLTKPAVGPAATGGPTQLTYRVQRLLNRDPATQTRWKRRCFLPLTLLLAGSVLVLAPLVCLSQAESPAGETSSDFRPQGNQSSPSATPALASLPIESLSTEQIPDIQSPRELPRDIRDGLESIQRDLNHALSLLEVDEDDPEILEAIVQLRERLKTFPSQSNYDDPE